MNNFIGIAVKLEIDEPWEKSEIVIGNVFKMFQYKDKAYLLVQTGKGGKKFIISERYVEEKFKDIFSSKKVHVAIGLHDSKSPINDNNIVDVIDKSIYYGIGSIYLVSV